MLLKTSQPLTYADISGGFFDDDDNDNEDKMVMVVDVADGNVDFLSEVVKFQTLLCVSILFLSSFFITTELLYTKAINIGI